MKAESVEKELLDYIEGRPPGERLPALGILAHQFRCSVNTVQRAAKRLESRGLLLCRRGSGIYVADPTARLKADLPERRPGFDPRPMQLSFPDDVAPLMVRGHHLRFMCAENMPDQVLAWQMLIAAFERMNPSVKIELCYVPMVADDIRTAELKTMLADADVFHLCNAIVTRRLMQQDFLLDLIPYLDVAAAGCPVFESAYLERLYTVPVTCSVECTILNRGSLWRVDTRVADYLVGSWDEYKALRRRLIKPADEQGFRPAGSNLSPFSYLRLMGLNTTEPDSLRPEDVQALIEQYIDLIFGLKDALVYVGPHMTDRRLPEIVAFDTSDIWFGLGEEFRRRYLAVPLPLGPGGRHITTAIDLAVTRHTSHPFVAAEFIKFVLSNEGQRILADYGRLPVRPMFLRRWVNAVSGHFRDVQKVLDNRETVWYLKPGEDPDSLLGEVIDLHIENMIVSGKPPEEVARTLYDAIFRFQHARRRREAVEV